MDKISQYPTTFYRVSLKVVIRNEKNQVLVVKENNSDTWSLPGGGWDHGESEHEALARELHEEVGYQDGFTSKIIDTKTFWIESKKAWLLWLVYDLTPENMEFTVGQDCSEVAFIDPQEIDEGTPSRAEQWIRQNL